MRERRKKTDYTLSMYIVAIVVLAVIGSICFYTKQPSYQLRQYINTFNRRDYEGVYEIFYQDNLLSQYSKEELLSYMNHYTRELGLTKIEKGKMAYESQDKAFYEVIYRTKSRDFKQMISLGKRNGKWYVECPFETNALSIEAPEGSQVYINGKEVKCNKAGERRAEVLGGDYTVRIVYPQQIQEDYVTKVKVPQQTEVISPYTTVPVEVIAPKGTTIVLAGIKKENQTGSVRFDKVLEGKYEVHIFDQLGYMDPVVKSIQVIKGLEPIIIDQIELSAKGEDSLKSFINDFYNVYLECMRLGKKDSLEVYLKGDNKESIMEDFSEWFIQNKQVTSADMVIELDTINMDKNGDVVANILEVVKLTNKEQLQSGKNTEREYQVTLRWETKFGVGADGYYVKNRVIQESLVAQKDNKNNWVQY